MNELIIRPATLSDRALIRSISERMLEWMYSDASLEKQMNTVCEFYIANLNGDDVGFCSVSPEAEDTNEVAHKLNKLYVLPSAQGTGAGKALLNKSIEVAKASGSSSLFLQVNKQNDAYAFYLKHGFVKEQEFKFDIGNGFFMDDYVMRFTF